MAGDTLKKVRTGDPLTIPASAYNAFVDAARGYEANRRDPATNQPISASGTVLIRNDTGEEVPRFGVLGIDRPLIGPGDNEQAFKNRIALSGVKPEVDRHTGRFAILAEPLKKGKIGRAFMTGVCPVKIKIATDSSGSGSGVAPSSSEPIPSSSTTESSSASSSVAASSSGSQSASASGSVSSSASTSTPVSSGAASGSGSYPQSSGVSGGSGSGLPGSGGGSGGGSGDGGSGGGGSGGGGSGVSGNTSGSGSSSSGSSSSSSSSSGGVPTFWYHLDPCDDDSSAQHNLYIVGNDVPSGEEDCVPRPSSSGATSGSASGSGSGQGSGGGGSGGGGSGGGGSGDPGGGSGSGESGSGASGSHGSGGSGSQLSGASSGQAGSSGSDNQSGSATQSSGGAGSSGDHGGGESSGSTTAQPVAGPLFMADIADGQTGHLVPCPWGAAAVLWVDDDRAASGSASSDGESRWAIVRLDGGQSVGDPFLTQIELADGSSGNCRSPANWTYNLRSLRGDKLADGVAVIKPRALGRTTPNVQGYGLAVRVLDGDQAILKLWDAAELHDGGPCEEASSSSSASASGSSSVSSTSSGSSSSVSSSASGSGASSSASGSSSTSVSSSTPPSGSASGVPSGSASESSPGSSGSASGSGGGSGGGDSGGGGSGGGGSGGGGSGSAGGSSSGPLGSSSSSGSASGSPSSSGSPPTTIKYNGKCYSVDDSAGYITLPSDAQVISPGEWWADCDGCKATCCASHNTTVCRGCFSSNSTADMTFELTETYFATDYSPQRTSHWKFTGTGPIDCNNAHWSAVNPTVLYEEDGQDKTSSMCGSTVAPSLGAALGGNQPDWWMAATRGTCGPDIYGSYGTLFAGKGGCRGIHETITQDITFFGPNPDWNPDDPNSPMEIEQTVGTRTIKYDVSIKNNTCCMDDSGHCQNRGQGQTYCDGGCVEEPPLP